MAFKNNNTVEVTSAVSETVISNETKFKGAIETDKPLVIEGSFEGEIASTSSIYVAETGTINAKIACDSMTMLGRGQGTIICAGSLEFGANGEFLGDVTTKNIVMVAGSRLEGQTKIG